MDERFPVPNLHRLIWIFLGCLICVGITKAHAQEPPSQRVWTIMPLGDSITEGNAAYVVYRRALLDKLTAAGYRVKYVGSKFKKSSANDAEPLPHEGYSGKSVHELEAMFAGLYQQNPADILLIHAGHNQFADQKPIPGMMVSTRKLIETARRINPKVKVLLAQVITAGKLPKYAYIPEYNLEVAKLAQELNTPAQPVILVNQADGFDWQVDTIKDKVHPSASGAEKMASRWFEALVPLLGQP